MALYGNIGDFGDERLSKRGGMLLEYAVNRSTVVLRRLGGKGAAERAAGRFLANPKVQREEIVQTVSLGTARQCAGRRIVVAQDTTEINFSGREGRRRGLGPAGDGKSAGFFTHAGVAIDFESQAVIGLLDAEIWSRKPGTVADRKKRPFDDKESKRWLSTMQRAGERAAAASQLIIVGDRESDIYEVFAHRPEGVELVVRAAQNRSVQLTDAAENGSQSKTGRLFDQPASWPLLGTGTIHVEPNRIGGKARDAEVEIRAARVVLRRPRSCEANIAAQIALTLVESRELNPPPGVEPVRWLLLSTLPAESLAQAQDIVQLYRLRWRIEQVFRALKNDGLALPDTQVAKVDHLLKLAAIALVAAVRILQLVDARDGSPRPASDIIAEHCIEPVAAVGASLEGKTDLQKNKHPPASLAWLAWIVARLGGWNCYGKKPGPKTMNIGWNCLTNMVEGYLLAAGRRDVSFP